MARYPRNFQISAEPAVASYDYEDIADGTGYRIFYAASAMEGGTPTQVFLLTKSQIYSYVEGISNSGTATTTFQLTPLNTPLTIKGKVFVMGGISARMTGGTGSVTNYLDITIRRYIAETGGTEDLGTSRTHTVTQTGNGNTQDTFCVQIDVSEKNLKRDDALYLLVEINKGGSGAGTGSFGCDPQNRDYGSEITPSSDSNVTTKLEVHTPFELDL